MSLAAPLPRTDAQPRLTLGRRDPGPRVPRGFALYVGVDEAAAGGADLRRVVEHLLVRLAEVAPGSETAASVVVAPAGSGGRSIDVVRQVMLAGDGQRGTTVPAAVPSGAGRGVVIDLTRNRVTLDGRQAGLTLTELALLRLLVENEGRDVGRAEIIDTLWAADTGSARPTPRTVDVHVRRLRVKLGAYEDIVRTVRGAGYRFDPHADVIVLRAAVTGSAR